MGVCIALGAVSLQIVANFELSLGLGHRNRASRTDKVTKSAALAYKAHAHAFCPVCGGKAKVARESADVRLGDRAKWGDHLPC